MLNQNYDNSGTKSNNSFALSKKHILDVFEKLNPSGGIRYSKAEQPVSPWVVIQDTQEAMTDAIRKGAMFVSTPALSVPYDELNPDVEINRFDGLVIDLDDKKNPGNALRELLVLTGHLQEIYGIDPYCIRFWCSGSKGFHAEIPAECFNSQAGDPYLPLIYKKIVCQWAASLELLTIDCSMYCMGKGKMFRLENVKRRNGRCKVPLTLDEVQSLPIEILWRLPKNPREVEPVEANVACEDLAALYQECKKQVHAEIAELKNQPPADPDIINRLKDQVAPCIVHILRDNPKADTTFNIIVMNLCKYFRDTESSLNNTLSVIEKFLQSYPHSTSYTSYLERLKHFKEQWSYHQGRTDNPFRCSYILGMKLKGSAFECKKCQLKKPDEQSTGDTGESKNEKPPGFPPLTPKETRVAGRLLTPPPQAQYILYVFGRPLIKKGIVFAIIGAGGSGKSFLTKKILTLMASGEHWGPFSVPRKLNVLYLSGEDDLADIDRRLWDIRPDGQFPDGLHVASVVGRVGALMEFGANGNPQVSKWRNWLLKTIQAHPGLDVLVIDPLSKFYGLSENSNENANAFIAMLQALCVEIGTGLNICYVHHANKASMAEAGISKATSRGASAFRDGVRFEMTLKDIDAADAKRYGIDGNIKSYFKMGITKTNFAGEISAPIFFMKNATTGVPEFINLDTDRLQRLAETFYDNLFLHNKSERRRDLLRGKPVELFDKIKGESQNFKIKDMPMILEFLLKGGALTEEYEEHRGQQVPVIKVSVFP